jgi:hypothetical protein
MKVVNESRGVIETSFHSINGKHRRIGRETDCKPKVPMSTEFPAKPILI